MSMQLQPTLLAKWCSGVWEKKPPPAITGIATDSRNIAPGNLFIALRGAQCDGHQYVGSALQAGAAGAVVERDYVASNDQTALLRVKNSLQALQDMARGYRQAMPLNPLVGVTGSVGKTSVKEMIADVLATQKTTARTRGNWNNHVGLPLSILNMPATATCGVFEIGISHPKEMLPLCQILAPTCGVITNIGPVHIEHFDDESAITDEKAELLKALPANGTAFLQIHLPYFERLRSLVSGQLITLDPRPASSSVADFFCTAITGDTIIGNYAHFAERGKPCPYPIHLPLPGQYVVANMLFAIAVGRTYGVNWDAIVNALENYRPPPMRWESLKWRGVSIINDAYNANPMSMREALNAFSDMPAARKWVVLGDMLELGDASPALHRELGSHVAKYNWAGVITVGKEAAAIAEVVSEQTHITHLYQCRANTDAAAVLLKHLKPGDLVLLKASRGIALEKVVAILKASNGETNAE